MKKILLFDLDGTLLTSEKTISQRTLEAVLKIRDKGYLIGVSTSRSESNSLKFIDSIRPEIIISSGGAMVSVNGKVIFTSEFSGDKTFEIIKTGRNVCGDINITVDTAGGNSEFYRNFDPPKDKLEESWGKSIKTDFADFDKPSLKICFEIFDEEKAGILKNELPDCDMIRFTDGYWYKVTRSGITKETAIEKLCEYLGVDITDVTAFGDDLADIGMLKMCGTGVAMGNALDEVKTAADITIGSNDEDGIADYLMGL